MKKLFLLLGVTSLARTSCSSSDDSSTTNPAAPLLKKVVESYSDGTSLTTNFVYNGTHLMSWSASDDSSAQVTYTGDNITKIEYFEGNELDQRDLYTYNSAGQLITYIRLDIPMEWGNREDFTYNSNGTITVVAHNGDLVSQTDGERTTIMTLTNGEVTSSVSDSNTFAYTYDDKHIPETNIAGYSKISFIDGSASGIIHNLMTEVETTFGDTYTTTNTYNYNAAGYPTTQTEDYEG